MQGGSWPFANVPLVRLHVVACSRSSRSPASGFADAIARDAQPTAATASWSGYWTGAVAHRGRILKVAVDVPASPDAPALVDYPDVPIHAAPFQWRVEGETLHLRREPPGGPQSTMRLERRDGALHGVFTGAGAVDAALVLERSDDAPPACARPRCASRTATCSWSAPWCGRRGAVPSRPWSSRTAAATDIANRRSIAAMHSVTRAVGVAALIYDKRGSGASSGDWRSASLEDLADDALAGLRALQALDGIRDRPDRRCRTQPGRLDSTARRHALRRRRVRRRDVGIGHRTDGAEPVPQPQRDARGGIRRRCVEQAQALRGRMYRGVETGEFDEHFERDLRAVVAAPWFAASQLAHTADGARQRRRTRVAAVRPAAGVAQRARARTGDLGRGRHPPARGEEPRPGRRCVARSRQ